LEIEEAEEEPRVFDPTDWGTESEAEELAEQALEGVSCSSNSVRQFSEEALAQQQQQQMPKTGQAHQQQNQQQQPQPQQESQQQARVDQQVMDVDELTQDHALGQQQKVLDVAVLTQDHALERQQQILDVDELTQDHALDVDEWVVDRIARLERARDPRSRSRSRELRALIE
jgi:hypothetical protein